jgi:RNA polymerase sigma-70 factor (TIGR02943 family)
MAKQPLATAAEATDPASWVDRHGNYLFGYALRRLRQPELAEDLVQEALLAALRGRDQFTGASAERTWLVGILKRKIVDHLRRQHREQPASNLADDGWIDELFDKTGHWKKGPAKWVNPSAAFENAEFWQTFSQCLDQLPRPQADAFSLREMDELSSAEVCKVLDISATHLGVMMHRARMRLCRCLDRHWFEGQRSAR